MPDPIPAPPLPAMPTLPVAGEMIVFSEGALAGMNECAIALIDRMCNCAETIAMRSMVHMERMEQLRIDQLEAQNRRDTSLREEMEDLRLEVRERFDELNKLTTAVDRLPAEIAKTRSPMTRGKE